MKHVVGKTYRSKRNGILGPWRMSGLELDDCLFDNCQVSCSWRLQRRFLIQNVTFLNCGHIGSGMDAAVLEDVIVDGWRNEGRIPLFAWACVFKHVSLRGRITAIKLTDGPAPSWVSRRPDDWSAANRAYYAQVDWALDIREAKFTSAPELHFIPGSLIRRDPETQALVTREQAVQALSAGLPWGESGMEIALRWFVDDGPYDDVVLVAARAAKYFRRDLATLAMLRREGLAA